MLTAAGRQRLAAGEIVVAAAIWGYGFVATADALRAVGPLWMSVIRFVAAALLALPLLPLFARGKAALDREQIMMAAVPAVLIGLMMVLQTWGLRHTSVTNSGFITALYVLIVPVLELVVLRRKVGALHFVWVGLALGGIVALCGLLSGERNLGDLLTLGCAFCGALHILRVDSIAHRIASPLAFNVLQSAWAAAALLPFAVLAEPLPTGPWDDRAAFGMAWIIVGSTMIGFMLQFSAQRHVTPRLASLLFLLESPFAALFAWLFLAEAIAPVQGVGAGLILLAAMGAVLTRHR